MARRHGSGKSTSSGTTYFNQSPARISLLGPSALLVVQGLIDENSNEQNLLAACFLLATVEPARDFTLDFRAAIV
jgi:hypothetical protein